MRFLFNKTSHKDLAIAAARQEHKEKQLELHKENILNMCEQLHNKAVLNVSLSLHNSLENYKMLQSMDKMKEGINMGLDYKLYIKNNYLKIEKLD